MPIRAIAYVSEAAHGLGIDAVDDRIREAGAFNISAGVTGVLLFDGSRFLQYVEGPEDGLAVAYSRITNAASHSRIVELGRTRTGCRNFPYWSMRLLHVEPGELQAVANGDWSSFVVRQSHDGGPLHGVEILARILIPFLGHTPAP